MIQIQLDQPSAEYRPDESIAGTILWDQLDTDVERIEIRLIWYTEGKGTRDLDLVAVETVNMPGASGRHNFEFRAPHRPFSFSGLLISVLWAIEVIEFPSQDAESKRISISPSGKSVSLDQSHTKDVRKKAAFRFGPTAH